MAIKDKVLELLDDNKGKYLSGEQLADTLGCTRGAVWKAVKALQENGYPISAVTNKGYSLDENTDILSLAGIKKYLDPDRHGLEGAGVQQGSGLAFHIGPHIVPCGGQLRFFQIKAEKAKSYYCLKPVREG